MSFDCFPSSRSDSNRGQDWSNRANNSSSGRGIEFDSLFKLRVLSGAGSLLRGVSPTARVDRRHEAALDGLSTPATQALPVGNVVLVERDPTHTALPGIVGSRDRLALFPSGAPSGNNRRTKCPDDLPSFRDRQASPCPEDFPGAGSRVTGCVLNSRFFRVWSVGGVHEGDRRSSRRWIQDNAGKWNAENTCTMLCDSVPGHF